jgi:hypothetical protein
MTLKEELPMNRAPAFQFYAADWFDFKVQRMSFAAQGAYIKLLAFMWKDSKDQCSLLDCDQNIATALGTTVEQWLAFRAEIQCPGDEIFREILPKNGEKFGKLFSERLHHESVKLRKYHELQSEKGKKSAQQRFNRGSTTVQPKHQPKGNSSSSSSSSDEEEDIPIGISSCATPQKKSTAHKKETAALPPEAHDSALQLVAHVESFPKAKKVDPGTVTAWTKEFERLHRIDGKSWEDIREVLTWTRHDPFWSTTILSGGKFREKWNTLTARMTEGQHRGPPHELRGLRILHGLPTKGGSHESSH